VRGRWWGNCYEIFQSSRVERGERLGIFINKLNCEHFHPSILTEIYCNFLKLKSLKNWLFPSLNHHYLSLSHTLISCMCCFNLKVKCVLCENIMHTHFIVYCLPHSLAFNIINKNKKHTKYPSYERGDFKHPKLPSLMLLFVCVFSRSLNVMHTHVCDRQKMWAIFHKITRARIVLLLLFYLLWCHFSSTKLPSPYSLLKTFSF
jgi:hypothetical protein